LFASGADAVTVEGPEGIGKTTTLALFAQARGADVVSVFVRRANRWSLDLDILVPDLLNQLECNLGLDLSPSATAVDAPKVISLFGRLGRKRTATRKACYVVLDGLISDALDEAQVSDLLDLLPLGSQHFKFLCSGDSDRLRRLSSALEPKPLVLPFFALDETRAFLGDLVSDARLLEELHQTARGLPGYLSSIRRLLESGMAVEALLASVPPRDLDRIFDVEWSRIANRVEWHRLLLAAIAFDSRRHFVSSLADVLGVSVSDVRAFVVACPLLELSAEEEVRFASDTLRRAGERRLLSDRHAILKMFVARLDQEKMSPDSVRLLPSYYRDLGQLDDVVSTLSPSFFRETISLTESLTVAQRHALLGVETATKMGRDIEATRFRLHRSGLSDLTAGAGDVREIRAFVALGQPAKALALARGASLREMKFKGLAAAISSLAKSGFAVDPELVTELRRLFQDIDPATIRRDTVDVAASLLDVAPDIAIGLMESLEKAEGDPAALDRAFLRLSIVADVSGGNGAQPMAALEQMRQKIADPRVRGMSSVLTLVTTKKTADEAIEHAIAIESSEERILFARVWLVRNYRREDAIRVGRFALDEILRTPQLSLTAAVLRQCAEPLRFCPPTGEAVMLARAVEDHLERATALGPTQEAIGIRIVLAISAARRNQLDGENALARAYEYSEALLDPALRLLGLANVLASLSLVSPEADAEERRDGTVAKQVRDLSALVLRQSAEQAVVLADTLAVLAPRHLDLAVEVAQGLNTQSRRDAAFEGIVLAYLHEPADMWRLEDVCRVLGMVSDSDLRDSLIATAASRLAEDVISRGGCELSFGGELFREIKKIGAAELKVDALAHLLVGLPKGDAANQLRNAVKQGINTAVRTISDLADRSAAAFEAVTLVVESDPELAEDLAKVGEVAKAEQGGASVSVVRTMTLSAALAVRAMRGLMMAGVEVEANADRVLRSVERIPDVVAQALLLTELAVDTRFRRDADACRGIVNGHLRPLLAAVGSEERDLKEQLIHIGSPALYLAHPADAKWWWGQLTPRRRDGALHDVVLTLMTRRSPREPYDWAIRKASLVRYEELLDVLDVANEMTSDVLVFDTLRKVGDSLCDDRGRPSLTAEQRTVVRNKYRDVALSKFPAKTGIQHEGYVIAAEAQLLRSERGQGELWDGLARRARAIGNLSDRAYVLGLLAEAMPAREDALRRVVAEEAEATLDGLAIAYERVARCHDLASMLKTFDKGAARRLIERGFHAGASGEEREFRSVQRSLIDLAYQIDPDFARSLAAMSDDDPVRSTARAGARDRLERLEAREALRSGLPQVATEAEVRRSASVAWELLGCLNAGTVSPRSPEELTAVLEAATSLGFRDGFWLWSWILENMVARYARTAEARRFILPFFEGTLLTGEIVNGVELRTKDTQGSRGMETVVRVGDRERALQIVELWCREAVPNDIVICDPYFGPPELEIVQRLHMIAPKARFQIVTSRKHHSQTIAKPWDEAYRAVWRDKISLEDPPDVEITVVGYDSDGRSPIHDRYILGPDSGLRLGTSISGIGIAQESSITRLLPDDFSVASDRAKLFFTRTIRLVGGQKVRYEGFTLSADA
jgi:hypothetical protein